MEGGWCLLWGQYLKWDQLDSSPKAVWKERHLNDPWLGEGNGKNLQSVTLGTENLDFDVPIRGGWRPMTF